MVNRMQLHDPTSSLGERDAVVRLVSPGVRAPRVDSPPCMPAAASLHGVTSASVLLDGLTLNSSRDQAFWYCLPSVATWHRRCFQTPRLALATVTLGLDSAHTESSEFGCHRLGAHQEPSVVTSVLLPPVHSFAADTDSMAKKVTLVGTRAHGLQASLAGRRHFVADWIRLPSVGTWHWPYLRSPRLETTAATLVLDAVRTCSLDASRRGAEESGGCAASSKEEEVGVISERAATDSSSQAPPSATAALVEYKPATLVEHEPAVAGSFVTIATTLPGASFISIPGSVLGALRLIRLADQLLSNADDRDKQEQALRISIAAVRHMQRARNFALTADATELVASELDRAEVLLREAVHLVRSCSSSDKWRAIAAEHGIDVNHGESPLDQQRRELGENTLRRLQRLHSSMVPSVPGASASAGLASVA